MQDQQAVLRPDVKTPFTSHEDMIKRLTPYHVSYDPSPTPADVEKGEYWIKGSETCVLNKCVTFGVC